MKPVEVYKVVVDAWEALPGGRNYSRQEIQDWLVQEMKPAIDLVREQLKTLPKNPSLCPNCGEEDLGDDHWDDLDGPNRAGYNCRSKA